MLIDHGFNFNMPSVAENEKDRYALFLFKHYLSTPNTHRWVISIWRFKITKWLTFMMVTKTNSLHVQYYKQVPCVSTDFIQ